MGGCGLLLQCGWMANFTLETFASAASFSHIKIVVITWLHNAFLWYEMGIGIWPDPSDFSNLVRGWRARLNIAMASSLLLQSESVSTQFTQEIYLLTGRVQRSPTLARWCWILYGLCVSFCLSVCVVRHIHVCALALQCNCIHLVQIKVQISLLMLTYKTNHTHFLVGPFLICLLHLLAMISLFHTVKEWGNYIEWKLR